MYRRTMIIILNSCMKDGCGFLFVHYEALLYRVDQLGACGLSAVWNQEASARGRLA